MEKLKVRLKEDLTKYGEGLKEGIEGYTIGEYGMWSRGSDRFVGVCFPGVKTLDVLWDSLEIIDEDFLQKREERKRQFKEDLRTAYNVDIHVGPRGGFRYLCYSYNGGNICHGFKDEAEQIEKVLKEYNIEIKIVIDN